MQTEPHHRLQFPDATRDEPTGQPNSNLRKPLGILFDLGDTLLMQLRFDPDAGIAATLEIAKNPSGYTAGEISKEIERIKRDLIPRRQKAQVEFHPHLILRHVYEPLQITFDCTDEEVERLFWRTTMSWQPEPGVEEVLQSLQERGIPMGIVSNAEFSGSTLWWEVERQGLARYFRFLMSSAEYWVRKPHPLLLQTAAAKLGLEPSHVWYVGNTPLADVAGALNAGMGAIWYNRVKAPLDGPAPHAEVKSWHEFLNLIEP